MRARVLRQVEALLPARTSKSPLDVSFGPAPGVLAARDQMFRAKCRPPRTDSLDSTTRAAEDLGRSARESLRAAAAQPTSGPERPDTMWRRSEDPSKPG